MTRHKAAAALSISLLAISGCSSDGGGASDFVENPPVAGLEIIEFAGQSNAGLGGSNPTLESRPLFGNVLQFGDGGRAGLGFENQRDDALVRLEPAHDDTGGQFLATLTGFALAAGGRGGEYLVRTDWHGGSPISRFVEGSRHFENTLRAMRAANAIAFTRPVQCSWYVWVQGESGPYDRLQYTQELRDYVSHIVPAIARELGQAAGPTFVILQTTTGDNVGPGPYGPGDSVALAQWDVARTTPGVILAGPMYQAPIIRDPQDNIHTTSLGRMVLADMLAAVKAAGPQWRPLQPTSATLDRNVLTLRFNVPGRGLKWDTSWIAPAPNFGFAYEDDDRSATIDSVRIIRGGLVQIRLSAVPTGAHKVIRYAMGDVDRQLDGWAGARGQLVSPTERPSLFWQLGYPVPPTVDHYAVRFELSLP